MARKPPKPHCRKAAPGTKPSKANCLVRDGKVMRGYLTKDRGAIHTGKVAVNTKSKYHMTSASAAKYRGGAARTMPLVTNAKRVSGPTARTMALVTNAKRVSGPTARTMSLVTNATRISVPNNKYRARKTIPKAKATPPIRSARTPKPLEDMIEDLD